MFQFVGGRFAYRVLGAGQPDEGQFEDERFVDFLSGAAMLVKADVIKELGLFDPRFFIYTEELDFAARAKKEGYKFVYSPKGRITHRGRHSIDRRFEEPYVTQSARNLVLLMRKHTGKQRLEFGLRAVSVVGKSAFGIIVKEKSPRRLKQLAQAILEGTKV